MPDFKTMDPREFVRGLMHGDRREFKLGYSAESAVLTVCRVQEITDHGEATELLDYAVGFAAGMVDEPISADASRALEQGFRDGQDTDSVIVYPACGTLGHDQSPIIQ